MLMFETTVDEDPHDKYNLGKPRRMYKFPKEFIKPNTETRRFMEIIDILAHTFNKTLAPSKLNIPEWKVSYPEALEELLGSKIEPQAPEEFQNLQFEVLKRFENAMKILLKILKKHQTQLRNRHY